MKAKLIQQLESMASALERSDQENLYMRNWYHLSTDHACGYAACVIGETVLRGDLAPFGVDFEDLSGRYCFASDCISEKLNASFYSLTGSSLLSKSIHDIGDEGRKCAYMTYIKEKKLLPTLEDHPHLTKEDPTPAEAKDYIEQIIKLISNS